MLTPHYVSVTVPAGQALPVDGYGRHILIVSISASTMQLSIGSDPFEQIVATEQIDCEDRRYSRVRLRNVGAVAATVVLIFSQTKVSMQGDGGILTSINTNVVSINQEISGSAAAAVAGQLADTVCPVTPGPGQLLFAANPNRTEIEVQADLANGAEVVYLGVTNARATAIDKFYILAAGGNWWSNREKGAIYACSSLGTGIVYGREC
jgi:hypothetical protein